MAEYIERETLLDALGFEKKLIHTVRDNSTFGIILSTPAADVAPVVHSRWEECDYVEPCVHGFGTNRIKNAGMKCLNCVHVFKKDLLWKDNFCPNCGAKMSGENNAID